MKTEMILTEGHKIYKDNKGKVHVTFYNNPMGKMLKEMWAKLNTKPKERKRNVWKSLYRNENKKDNAR